MEEFRSYLKDIEGFPDFREDPGGVSASVEKMRDGDKKAALSLIESTLKYIVELATAHCRRWGAWQNQLDLVQEANTEVSEKIKDYDPAEASLKDFISYRSYIAFVRFWYKSKAVHVTDHGRKIVKSLQRAHGELTVALGREPTLEELSERVGRDESEVYAMQKHPGVTVVGISTEGDDEADAKTINLDFLASTAFDPFPLIEATELRELLIDCLGETGADLLLAYFDLKTEGFRQLHFQIHGREISAVAARKAKERLLKKLKNCLRVKERFSGRGKTR
jgi:DNA-directed RNA polymerase sigma subunit (sigma70/sigma32)